MRPLCTFSIPRGNTARYIYVFDYYGKYYNVTKKVLYSGFPYIVVSVVKVPTQNIMNYINTVVALTY
jgi:hypothetical protein